MEVTFEEFRKLEIRIGRILTAEKVGGSAVIFHPDEEVPVGSVVR